MNDLFLLEGIQRKASRFIVGKGSDLLYRDRLIMLRLLPLNYWLEYLDLVFFYKCLNNLVDLPLNLITISLLFWDTCVVHILLIALRLIMLIPPFSDITFSVELR